jgi:hypothetical protein
VQRQRTGAEVWAQGISIVCGKGFVESDQFVVMQTMGRRAKGRPALGRMPQFLRFLRIETEQRDPGSGVIQEGQLRRNRG